MTVHIKADLSALSGAQQAVDRLMAAGRHTAPLMKELAAYGESSTRERFATETAPDGTPWKASFRKELFGGKTLTRDGHLSGSITSASSDAQAQWGSNRIYAAIHQEGGVITVRHARFLHFQLADGTDVVARLVVMPARPYLGISADDGDEMEYLALSFLDCALQGG